MTKLRTFANLWTLWDHPGRGAAEWPLAQKISAIAKAGFDGVMGELSQGVGPLAAQNGLCFIAFKRLDETHDFDSVLANCRDEGAIELQVHLGSHDTTHDRAVKLALRLEESSRKAGIETVIETHRDTCTETPEKTEALQRDFYKITGGRNLPLLLDFSHHAVVKHLDPPYASRFLADRELVRRTRWHHLRPFNGHHAQIPVLTPDGSLTPEMTDWWDFAKEIFRLLHGSQLPEIWVCPEMGPVRDGYSLSGFPPSWEAAVFLQKLFKQYWSRLGEQDETTETSINTI